MYNMPHAEEHRERDASRSTQSRKLSRRVILYHPMSFFVLPSLSLRKDR